MTDRTYAEIDTEHAEARENALRDAQEPRYALRDILRAYHAGSSGQSLGSALGPDERHMALLAVSD